MIDMLKTFYISFRLKNTYRVNSIIYFLKQIPLIKKIISQKLYKSKGLKIFANIISLLIEIAKTLIGKLIYFIVMILLPAGYFTSTKATSTHILLFLSMIGMFYNSDKFKTSKDNYYAIFLLRINANHYAVVNYLYEILKVFLGFLICSIIFDFSWLLKIAIPLFVVSCKHIYNAVNVIGYKKKYMGKRTVVLNILISIASLVCLLAAYGLPFLGFALSEEAFLMISLVVTLIGCFAAYSIVSFKEYKKFYQELFSKSSITTSITSQQIIQETVSKNINSDTTLTSNKHGFEYLNDLFIKRHKRILMKSAVTISRLIVATIVILAVFVIMSKEVAGFVNDILHNNLPWFLYLTYYMNRSEAITQSMFINCDHSLLTYAVYRKPKNIVKLFSIRLRDVIKINLIPGSVLAVGSTLLLFISGGSRSVGLYFLVFSSIIAMNVFFSVHRLVIYYLLQPYNINIESKGFMYPLINGLTYFGCYIVMRISLSSLVFCTIVIIGSVLYCLLSLALVYRFAPKTFKLRM